MRLDFFPKTGNIRGTRAVVSYPLQTLSFPPFHLDLANEQLWCGERLLVLRPKTFAILRYLVEHAERLVTKEELLHAVWGDTQVSDERLRDYVREIRQALHDDSNAPRFVETVRGRGRNECEMLNVEGNTSAVANRRRARKPDWRF